MFQKNKKVASTVLVLILNLFKLITPKVIITVIVNLLLSNITETRAARVARILNTKVIML